MSLMQWSFWLLAAVAAGGVLMAAMIALRLRIPAFLGTAHGLAGLAALACLFITNLVLRDAAPALAWWAFGVFLAGFVGGLLLFRVLFPGRAPLWLALGHGSVAVLGLYLLSGPAFGAS